MLQLDSHGCLRRASCNRSHLHRRAHKELSHRSPNLISHPFKKLCHRGHMQFHFALHQFQRQPQLPLQPQLLMHPLS